MRVPMAKSSGQQPVLWRSHIEAVLLTFDVSDNVFSEWDQSPTRSPLLVHNVCRFPSGTIWQRAREPTKTSVAII